MAAARVAARAFSFKHLNGKLPMGKLFCSALLTLGYSAVSVAAIPLSERAVLLSLFDSTAGTSWAHNANWYGAPGTECTWYGISCNIDGNHVTGISLVNNGLVGTLPFNLNQLSALQSVFLSQNQLSGSIPSLSGMTALLYLALDRNALTGNLPSFTGLNALQIIDVSNNRLSGTIPGIAELNALTGFYITSNQLTGFLPSLTGLTLLQDFYVGNNQLHGSVPAPPVPTVLRAAGSELCPNPFDFSPYPEWDTFTGVTPWYTACNPIFHNGFD